MKLPVMIVLILALLPNSAAIGFAYPSPTAPIEQPRRGVKLHVVSGLTASGNEATVESIAWPVVAKLEGRPTAAAAQPTPDPSGDLSSDNSDAFGGLDQVLARVGEVLKSLPDLGDNLANVIASLSGDLPGTGFALFILKLLLGAGVAVAAEKLVRRFIARRYREDRTMAPDAGWLLGRALLDAAALIPLWLILYGLSSHALRFNPVQQKVIHIVFTNVFVWRVVALILRIWFRPGMSSLRIAQIDDKVARTLYYAISVVVLCFVIVRSVLGALIAADAPANIVVVQAFVNNVVFAAIFLTATWIMRHAATRWLASLVNNDGSALARFKQGLAEHWWGIGALAVVVMSIAFAYGILTGNSDVGLALVLSLGLAVALSFLKLCSTTSIVDPP
jgi:hypothetical protein